MNKSVINLAVAVLLSLGVTACGSKQNETHINTSVNTTLAAELAAAKKAAETANAALLETQKTLDDVKAQLQAAENNPQDAKERVELQQRLDKAENALAVARQTLAQTEGKLNESETSLSTLQNTLSEKQTELGKIKNELSQLKDNLAKANEAAQNETAFIRNSVTGNAMPISLAEGYKLVTKNDRTSLANIVKAASDIEQANAKTFSADLPAGSVMAAKNLSYSGYAVVRESYSKEDRTSPANSYIFSVSNPTTDLSKVQGVSATYKGTASYSAKNLPISTTLKADNSFTLNLSNNEVSGDIRAGASKKEPEGAKIVTLNNAAVKVQNGVVSFDGNATFNEAFSGKGATSGSYKGAFAGENAEEVIGTFETETSTKEAGMQGAFAGSKQP